MLHASRVGKPISLRYGSGARWASGAKHVQETRVQQVIVYCKSLLVHKLREMQPCGARFWQPARRAAAAERRRHKLFTVRCCHVSGHDDGRAHHSYRQSTTGMKSTVLDNAGRVSVCAVLLGSAMAATVAEREAIDLTTQGRADGVGDVAAMDRTMPVATLLARTQLAAAVHPAADPHLGWMWSASRRLIMPVAGVQPDALVDTFGQIRGPDRRHEAIDIPAPRGTPVLAVTDGEILRLTEHDSGGTTLYLLAPDGQTMFYYAHLLRYADGVKPGLRVRQGDVIGHVGDSGNAGPGNYHLHFEVMTAPDPRQYQAVRPRNPYPLLRRTRG